MNLNKIHQKVLKENQENTEAFLHYAGVTLSFEYSFSAHPYWMGIGLYDAYCVSLENSAGKTGEVAALVSNTHRHTITPFHILVALGEVLDECPLTLSSYEEWKQFSIEREKEWEWNSTDVRWMIEGREQNYLHQRYDYLMKTRDTLASLLPAKAYDALDNFLFHCIIEDFPWKKEYFHMENKQAKELSAIHEAVERGDAEEVERLVDAFNQQPYNVKVSLVTEPTLAIIPIEV